MDVRLPDGTIIQGVPDNITKADLVGRLQKNGMAVPADWLDAKPAQVAKPDRGINGMVGDLVAGGVRGAGSIGATLLTPYDLIAGNTKSIGNPERRQAMDQALGMLGADTDSKSFTAGKVAGEIAGTAGAGGVVANAARAAAPVVTAAPKVANALRAIETSGAVGGNMATRAAGGAVSGGVSAGMVDPSQAGTGAMIGGAFPVVTRAAGAAGSRVANMVRPQVGPTNALADKAVNTYGIPLGVADVSGSPMTKAVRSVLNDAPFIGSIGEAQREGVQAGFNKAVGSTFGAPEAKLTAQVMDQAKARIGAEFDRIWNNNALQVDSAFMQKVIDLQRTAAKLPANEGGSLARELDDILSKVQPDQAGNLVVPGEVANRFQSYLRRRAEGSAGLRNELTDMRQSIIGAFNRSVSPADAAALTKNRGQYKAFKTVEPILNSAEAGVAGRVAGDIPAGLLPGAVLKSYGNAAGTELGDLSQIGSQFIADRVARTGGSNRALIQNSMVGGALGAGALTNPLLAAGVVPVAAGANWLLGNPAIGRMAAQPRNALALPVTAYRAAPLIGTNR